MKIRLVNNGVFTPIDDINDTLSRLKMAFIGSTQIRMI